MKDVEKGRTLDELASFVTIFEGYRALPIEKVESFERVRILDSIVTFPNIDTSDCLKPLKTKSVSATDWLQENRANNR